MEKIYILEHKLSQQEKTIGIISDTHGLLRPQALVALEGSDIIFHAGDIGSPEVLEALRKIAPVVAVRGNTDNNPWSKDIPYYQMTEFNGIFFYLLHDLYDLDLDPETAGLQVIISGHTHQPLAETKNNILYINPGSAGPRRFHLPICLAKLTMNGRQLHSQFIALSK